MLVSVCNVISVKHYQCDEHLGPGQPRHSRLNSTDSNSSPKFCPKTRTGPYFSPGSDPSVLITNVVMTTDTIEISPAESEGPTRLNSGGGEISHKPNVDGVVLPSAHQPDYT